eukprot:365020-Chlamydomonas_euryale.AAC.4
MLGMDARPPCQTSPCGHAGARPCGHAGARPCGHAGARPCGHAGARPRRLTMQNCEVVDLKVRIFWGWLPDGLVWADRQPYDASSCCCVQHQVLKGRVIFHVV